MNAREILFRLVVGDEDVARASAAIATEAKRWEEIVGHAFRWKVLPELNRSFSALGIVMTDPARSELRKLSRESFLRSSMVAARGCDALRVLDEEGISVLAFKGLAVVASAGTERGDRTLQDVDLVVERENLAAAIDALEKCGHRRGFPGELEDYLRFVQNSPGFSGNEALLLRAPDGGELDLHWRVGPRQSARFEAGSLLFRARSAEFRGRSMLIPCNVDAALLTVHHSLRNNLVPDDIIRDLLDLDAWLTRMEHDSELESFAVTARDCAMAVPALAMIEILNRVRPGPVAELARTSLVRGMSANDQSAAHKMRELFDVQLRNGALNADMLYLLRGTPFKSIVSGAFGGWSQYREQMAAFEMRKHGEAVPVSKRARLLLESVIHARACDWRGLRALAKAKI